MRSSEPELRITVRAKLQIMPDSVLKNVIAIFADSKIHSVEEVWEYIDGRTDRRYSYSDKMRRVTTYLHRANKLIEDTGRVIGRVSMGNYRLLHREL